LEELDSGIGFEKSWMPSKDNIFDKKEDIRRTIYTCSISAWFSVLLLPSEDHLYAYQVIAIVLLCDKSTQKYFPKA